MTMANRPAYLGIVLPREFLPHNHPQPVVLPGLDRVGRLDDASMILEDLGGVDVVVPTTANFLAVLGIILEQGIEAPLLLLPINKATRALGLFSRRGRRGEGTMIGGGG